ncbi:carboxypeptidase-like regulatory domain-containing protein [Hymenobacter coccineus]|uniref:Membrane receptor RagA n=1 Tax=Hymenobacter coccineus TaxID=1908235 RepID=A0A1G1TF77_9BACT|nr:carboxypeptidase-like regulatory domain-containing protein [Hymenobacter coccineus]OGX89524.1 hypothetical protein BEN49_09005 [Hymenobacter coccineus]
MSYTSRPRGLSFTLAAVLAVFLLLLAAPGAQAQGKRKVIQFTGIVASGDSLLGVPGATVYVPKAGRGTATNIYGYFSMAVLAGDSIVIRSLGYANEVVKIPADYQRTSYSVVVSLREDATVLPEVRVFPYATEREFKAAFLAMAIPSESRTPGADALNEQTMRRIFNTLPMSSTAAYRQTMGLQQQNYQARMGLGQSLQANNPLTNPFSWLKFVQQVKSGEFKKKEGVDY